MAKPFSKADLVGIVGLDYARNLAREGLDKQSIINNLVARCGRNCGLAAVGVANDAIAYANVNAFGPGGIQATGRGQLTPTGTAPNQAEAHRYYYTVYVTPVAGGPTFERRGAYDSTTAIEARELAAQIEFDALNDTTNTWPPRGFVPTANARVEVVIRGYYLGGA